MARRNERITAKILCANSSGDKCKMLRVAVLVKRGAAVERVAIVDVERQPDGFDTPRGTREMLSCAEEQAMYPSLVAGKGVRIAASAYDGGIFTGLGQPVDDPRVGSVSS